MIPVFRAYTSDYMPIFNTFDVDLIAVNDKRHWRYVDLFN